MCIIIQVTILRVSDKACSDHHRSMDKLQYYQCQPVYPVQSAKMLLMDSIHTQQSVIIIFKLHDGDRSRHHWPGITYVYVI